MIGTIVMAVVALVVAGVAARLASSARAERRTHADALAAAQRERDDERSAAKAERELRTGVELERDHHRRQADELNATLAIVLAERDAARSEHATATAALAAVTDELGTTRRRLQAASDGDDAEVLWSLELARSERRWRHSVAVDPLAPCPLSTAGDPLRVAVEIEADALREEAGARVEVRWALDEVLSPDRSLLVLRVAQELLAESVTRAERTELAVERVDGAVVVTRRGLDEHDTAIATPTLQLPEGRAVVHGDVVTIG